MAAKTIGFAVLGTGLVSKFHARALRDVPGARLVAVCSRERSRAEAFASEFGCSAFDSLEEVLAQPGVDALAIATPSGKHRDAALAAAKAGKHVLCEKPLEVTPERIDEMIAAHRAAGTRLGCLFQLRYLPALQPIREALREGRFGALTYAGVYVPWWRSNEYYSESSWRGTVSLDGGGALMNQSIHMIDLLCELLPPVESVAAFASSVGHPGLETEDACSAALRFQGGAVGVIYGTTSAWPGRVRRLEIAGTQGTAVLEEDRLTRFEFREPLPQDQVTRERFGRTAGAHGVSDPGAMTHALHAACFRDFVDALAAGRPFGIDGESARRSVALVCAAYRAAETGQCVRV